MLSGATPVSSFIFYLLLCMTTCRSGDVIELINTASDDWWKGSVGELKGYFPASYVQVYVYDPVLARY